MSLEIGISTSTSDAFLNQQPNKQTSHEKQKTPDSSLISFCTSSGKRQLKTLQFDTASAVKENKFQDAAKSFRMNSPVKF